jgi:hypothetical protein
VCLEQQLPPRVDLVLLEHLPYLEQQSESGEATEQLLHRLQLHLNSTIPPVVFFSMHR